MRASGASQRGLPRGLRQRVRVEFRSDDGREHMPGGVAKSPPFDRIRRRWMVRGIVEREFERALGEHPPCDLSLLRTGLGKVRRRVEPPATNLFPENGS